MIGAATHYEKKLSNLQSMLPLLESVEKTPLF